MNNRRLFFMIAVMLALVGALWFDYGWRSDSEEALPSALAATAPEYGEDKQPRLSVTKLAAVNPLADWPADALSEVLDRPLFNPSRRAYKPPPPVEAPPPPAPEAEPEPLDVVLTGVLLSENGHFALLKQNGSGKALRLKEGQSFDEWTLEEVGAREAILTGRGERHTLRLFEDRSSGGLVVAGKSVVIAGLATEGSKAVAATAVKEPRYKLKRKMADARRKRFQRSTKRWR